MSFNGRLWIGTRITDLVQIVLAVVNLLLTKIKDTWLDFIIKNTPIFDSTFKILHFRKRRKIGTNRRLREIRIRKRQYFSFKRFPITNRPNFTSKIIIIHVITLKQPFFVTFIAVVLEVSR